MSWQVSGNKNGNLGGQRLQGMAENKRLKSEFDY